MQAAKSNILVITREFRMVEIINRRLESNHFQWHIQTTFESVDLHEVHNRKYEVVVIDHVGSDDQTLWVVGNLLECNSEQVILLMVDVKQHMNVTRFTNEGVYGMVYKPIVPAAMEKMVMNASNHVRCAKRGEFQVMDEVMSYFSGVPEEPMNKLESLSLVPALKPRYFPNGLIPFDQLEAEILSEALWWNKGNVQKTARDLSLSKVTIYRKIKNYGLEGYRKGLQVGDSSVLK